MVDKIIDAHHHLWDLSSMGHTWLAEKNVTRFFGNPAPIQKTYHVPDFTADHGDIVVTGSVHIQCGVAIEDSVVETEFVQDQANRHGLVKAIIGFCDLTDAAAQNILDAHQAYPLFRGVRQIIGRDAKEDAKSGTNTLLEDPRFLKNLKTLVARDLSFDLQLTPPLLKMAAKVFGKVDALPVALCHAGSPQDFTRYGIRDWEAGLQAFADLPHTICKISGLGMFDHNWTVESFRDRILRTIDVFGPSRIAFGSNFPVDKLYASYSDTMGAYLKITEGFTRAERISMFHNLAQDFYRVSND